MSRLEQLILQHVSIHKEGEYDIAVKRQKYWRLLLRIMNAVAATIAIEVILVWLAVLPKKYVLTYEIAVFVVGLFTPYLIDLINRKFYALEEALTRLGALLGLVIGSAIGWWSSDWQLSLALGVIGAGAGWVGANFILPVIQLIGWLVDLVMMIGTPLSWPIKWVLEMRLKFNARKAQKPRGTTVIDNPDLTSMFSSASGKGSTGKGGYMGAAMAGATGLAALGATQMAAGSSQIDSETNSFNGDYSSTSEDPMPSMTWINPTTGLPMMNDMPGGLDVGGNLWGDTSQFDHGSSDMGFSNNFDSNT